MNNPVRAFWQQCERLYNSNRAPLLLNLQQSNGASVNLLLLALHLDQHNHPLAQSTWSVLSQHGEQFEQRILRPYRHRRKQIKAQSSQLAYQKILAIELVLERELQQQLAALLPPSVMQAKHLVRQALSPNNLFLYADTRNISYDLLKPIYSIN